MPSTNDEVPKVGDLIRTRYGSGVVENVAPQHVIAFVPGTGRVRIARPSKSDRALGSEHDRLTPSDGRSLATVGAEDERLRRSSSANVSRSGRRTLTPSSDTSEAEVDLEPPETVVARAAIEALRIGTVPPFAAHHTTVGRSQERQRVDKVLEQVGETRRGSVMVFSGPNGSGKTHLLRVLAELALRRGFVVLSGELEGFLRVTPKDLYRQAVKRVRWATRQLRHSGTLEAFLEAHRERLAAVPISSFHRSPLLSSLIQDMRNGGPTERVWDWILGDELYAQFIPSPYKSSWLSDAGTSGQTITNPMNALATLVADLGYKGIVLTIDEIELILNQDLRWGILGREWVRGLVLSAHGGSFKGAKGEFKEGNTPLYKLWSEWFGRTQPHKEFELRYGHVNPEGWPATVSSTFHAPTRQAPFVLALGYTDQQGSDLTVFDENKGWHACWLPSEAATAQVFEFDLPTLDDVDNLIEQLLSLYKSAYAEDSRCLAEGFAAVRPDLRRFVHRRLEGGEAASMRWAIQSILEAFDLLATGTPPDEVRRWRT